MSMQGWEGDDARRNQDFFLFFQPVKLRLRRCVRRGGGGVCVYWTMMDGETWVEMGESDEGIHCFLRCRNTW